MSSPTRRAGPCWRMLEQYLGPEIFRDGVRRYLAAHQFANAETADLWKALGEAAANPSGRSWMGGSIGRDIRC